MDPKLILLSVGSVFHGRYEVVRCLRAGGMGAVYEVIDQKTRKRRALKLMLPSLVADAELRARFRLEATITSEIESKHIIEILDADVDTETGAPFVAMELLKGEDLGAILARRGSLPPEEVIELLRQAALALDRTHAAGVVHRDLKPENLFVIQDDDGSPRLKVLDFGIAKMVAESGAAVPTTRAIGTPLYMPPEQIRGDGDIGPGADLYALAHLAYGLVVGEAYWKEELKASSGLFATFSKILGGPKETSSARALRRKGVQLPPAFDAWFARAAADKPADRFSNASSMIAELATVFDVAAPSFAARRVPVAIESTAAPGFTPPELHGAGSTTSALSTQKRASPPRGSKVPWIVGAALVVGIVVALVVARGPRTNDDGGAAIRAASPADASAPEAVVVAPSASASATQATPSARATAVERSPAAAPPPGRGRTPSPRASASRPTGVYDPTDTR